MSPRLCREARKMLQAPGNEAEAMSNGINTAISLTACLYPDPYVSSIDGL